MAIVDKQTECLRIITIGYLKNFIGDLIKDSNGNVVHVNEDAKPDFSNDSYCPTYSELTGGTLIPNHVEGESPEDDIDGIVVNSIFYNDGISPYTENQQVNQKDLSVAYTTFNGFSIGAEPTTINECGGESTLNFLYGFTRNLKYMTSNCTVTTSAHSITDLEGDDISWSTSTFGEITYPQFSVGKNGEISANSRTTIVTGRATFQGVDYTDTVEITQNALTGDYTAIEGRHYTGVSAFPTTPTSFDCGGGDYAIRATGYYYDRYNWVDSCGYKYVNVYKDTEGTEDAGIASGHFDEIICPSGDTEHPIHLSETLSIEYHGNTDSMIFTLDCVDRTDCAGCDGAMSVSSVTCFDHSAHTNVIIGNYELLSQDVTNIHINNEDYPSWLTNVVLDTSNMDITASMDAIPCETVGRNGSVIISFDINGKSCSIPFNVCQKGNGELCPCSSYTYSVNCKVDTVDLVCNADDDIDLNLTYIPYNEMQVKLSLDVLRKCIAPHETNWSKYDDYTVEWSVPSEISVVDPSAKVLVATIPTNNDNTEKQWTITATCTVDGNSETCQSTITQQAGPEWEYRVTKCPNNVSNIDACGTLITEFTGEIVQKRCAGCYSNPNEGWEAATRYTDYDIDFVGDDTFIDDADDHTAWQAWKNCTSSSRQQQYTVSIVRVDNGNVIDSCQVTFSQLAGPCESECE